MYGAILGDIVGSKFEFSKPHGFNHKKVPLFTNGCRFTDDTVLTVATKYAILNDIPYAKAYHKFGRLYRKAGYGPMFLKWLDNLSDRGYNSYGNGAAMRVSFIGYNYSTLDKTEREAEKSAMCTHDHPQGVGSAMATAGMIYLARNGHSKKEIAYYAKHNYGYNVSKPLFLHRYKAKFDDTAQGSMPLAIRCFLESDSWEDCMRKVLSVKCDTDTVCCISGGIAEAFYGTTGVDEINLLQKYLVLPSKFDQFDTFLYEWAVKNRVKRSIE